MRLSFSVIFRFLAIFQVLQWAFLIFHVFSVISSIFKSSSGYFSFSIIFSFLAILHVLQWTFLNFPPFSVFPAIFHVLKCLFLMIHIFSYFAIFQVLQFAFIIFHVLQYSPHISLPNDCYSHFRWFSVFSPYSRFYSVHFYFSCFSKFLVIFHYLMSVILIFPDFQFSCHIPGSTVCISHFSRCSVISSFFKSSSGCFSFSMIFSFLSISQVIQCAFLIFHVFQWFRHFSSRQMDVSHFQSCSVFMTYSMSYCEHF